MSVKKAIEMLDGLLAYHLKIYRLMEERSKEHSDNFKEIYNSIAHTHKMLAQDMVAIKRALVPNCKHPKKMRDKAADGQWYCMQCNSDID